MDRFDANARRFRARHGIAAVLLASTLLAIAGGTSVSDAGRRLDPGVERDVLLAIGRPAGWIARRLPVRDAVDRATAPLSPDEDLAPGGGFAAGASGVGAASAGAAAAVPPSAFAPSAIGAPAAPRRPLRTLLVTGDSLATPLDVELSRRLAGTGVRVIREPHLGTGISSTDVVDWGRLATTQVARHRPDAVVVFIGANEGFPMPAGDARRVSCCGAAWAALYATRVRAMMGTYRRGGAARVYWVTVPAVRDAARQRIERVVDAAIGVAAEPWRDRVAVVDTVPVFTPGGRYRDAMPVRGRQALVRRADGIHLNEAGARVLAGIVQARLSGDFTL